MPSLVRGILDRPPVTRPSRAQRRASREDADDHLVRAWLHANPMAPLGSLWIELPLSGRRIRHALGRLQAHAEGWQ